MIPLIWERKILGRILGGVKIEFGIRRRSRHKAVTEEYCTVCHGHVERMLDKKNAKAVTTGEVDKKR